MRYELQRDGFVVSDDRDRVDVGVVHAFLSGESYWAAGIDRARVQRSIDGSLCFGLYDDTGAQVGFARVVTDRATFAWLCDVFVLPAARGRGLARWLCQAVLDHPDLQGLRRFLLATKDAHPLYAGLGFTPLASPESWMERHTPARQLYAS